MIILYFSYKNPHTKVQHASGKFTLDLDISPVVNWNTNLIFIWITAHYQTGRENVNKAIKYYN